MNFQAVVCWLKQPSTIKAFVMAAGLAGYAIAPAQIEAITFIAGVFYAGVSAFYDQQPRVPLPKEDACSNVECKEK